MAGEFSSFISSSSQGGGSGGSGSRTQTAADVLGGIAQVAQTGLNIFETIQKKNALEAEAQSEALAKQASDQGTQLAADFTALAQDALAGGNPIAAQNFIASEYSKLLSTTNIDVGTAFRENVIKNLGFNPVAQVRESGVKAQEAAQKASMELSDQGRTYALGALGMPQEVFDSLPVEQQHSIAYEGKAMSDSIARQKARLDLATAQGVADQRVRQSAISAGASEVGRLADQRINSMLLTWNTVLDSGDPSLIAQTQTALQQQVAGFQVSVGGELAQGLSQLGYTGISEADVSEQIGAIRSKYALVQDVFSSEKWASANRNAQSGAVLAANGAALSGPNSDLRRVAATGMVDLAFSGNGTLISALNLQSQLTDLIVDQNAKNGNVEANAQNQKVQLLQDMVVIGPAQALANFGTSPELAAESSKVWGSMVADFATSAPEQRELAAGGIIELMNAGASGRGEARNAAFKSFMPMLDALAQSKVGGAYKEQLAGTEQVMGAYMGEFIASTLAPSTSRAVAVKDLNGFSVSINGDVVEVVPPVSGIGAFNKFSPTGGASEAQRRVQVTRGFRQPLQVIEKMALMSQNVYGIPAQVTREALIQQWAEQLGMQVTGLQEVDNASE